MGATIARAGLLTLLLATFTQAAAVAQVLTPIGDASRGERLFSEKACARCHGAAAIGSAQAPALTGSGRQRRPLELAATIWNHSPEMTAKARALRVERPLLTGSQTGDILAYLYSLGFVDEPGEAKRGLQLLKDKGCLACHTTGEGAPTDAPPLGRIARFASAAAMLEAMWRHAADMQDEMRALRLKRVAFSSGDMAHILAYFRSIGPAAADRGKPLGGDASEGAKLFAVKGCTRCHATHGYGGHIGQDFGSHKLPRTPGAMAGLLWNHGSRMRQHMDRYGVPLPTFTREELLNVVAYIYFLGFSDPPGDPVRGRDLFRARGCARCHGTGTDTRAREGPDLAHSQAVLSSLEAARLMWEHAPRMEARLRELGIRWPQFAPGELTDLIAYITSLRHTSTQ